PLSELGLFRLPPLAPNMTRAEVRTLVAQAIAGFVHDDYGIWYDQPNTVEVGFGVKLDAPGRLDLVDGPLFSGAAALAPEFAGVVIRSLPKVPLLVELSHEEHIDESEDAIHLRDQIGLLFYGQHDGHEVADWQHSGTPAAKDVERLADIFDAYPQ